MFHSVIKDDMDYIVSSIDSWEELSGKSVLITGVNGMIASYILYTLLYLNDTKHLDITVYGLTRNSEKTRERFGDLIEREDFKLVVQDIKSPLDMQETPNYIIHAASQTGPRQFVEDPVGTIAANNIGTYLLLEFARTRGVEKFLFLSTREIYGRNDMGLEYVTEEDYGSMDPTLIRSCYPESKRISETMCSAYREQYGLNCKIARIAHTYGPGILIGDGRVVGDFLSDIINRRNICMNSDGSAILALTYISDTILGLFMTLLEFDEFVYNISSEREIVTVKELAELLCGLFPERNLKTITKKVDESQSAGYLKHKMALLSSAKANNEGWNPMISLSEGFKKTIRYSEETQWRRIRG